MTTEAKVEEQGTEPPPVVSMPSGESIPIAQAFEVASEVQRRGYLESADDIYRRILEVAPEHLDALHFMALGRYRMGKRNDAYQMIRRVVEQDPTNVHALNNLGNMLAETKHFPEARAAFEKALEVDPNFAGALANLGVVKKKQDDLKGAEADFRRALELDPNHGSAMHNLGSLLWDLDRIGEALKYFLQALKLMPYDGESFRRVGAALSVLGRASESKALYERWLEREPDNVLAQHMYAASTGQAVPARASDEYVAETFDTFADSFDTVLARLEYRAPSLVAAAVASVFGPTGDASRDVLDAGAGTGLCGPLLRPHARRLVGIDLSAKMLQKAKEREGIYDELTVAELTAYIDAHPEAFDVIGSADTLCYFGELEAFAAAVARSLRAGGLLVFTVEHAKPELGVDHRLNLHGRYSHSEAYVRRVLGAAGLTDIGIGYETLRYENKIAVSGLVVTARRA